MNAKLVLLTGATVLALLLGSAEIATVQADGPRIGFIPNLPWQEGRETPAQPGVRIYGVIEAIEGKSLALTTPVGPVTVITDANTRFRVSSVEEPGLDDLAAGDYIGAAGWWEKEESIFHAFGVAWVETDCTFPLAGKLADVSDTTLTVETGHGLATVRVNGETVYRIHGVEEPGLNDFEVGVKTIIRGTLNPDGSLLAQMVAVPWIGSRPIRLQGEVLAVEGGAFIIRAARGRQSSRRFTMLTDEATEFHVLGVENFSIADLQVGDRIVGEGVIGEDGTFRAVLVVVLPRQVARLVGEVIGIEGATLELDTPGGKVNVITDAEAVFHVPGIEEPALDDVQAGDRVSVTGTWGDETTFHAIAVGVRCGRRAGQQGVLRGRVVRVENKRLVIGTPRGPVTVLVDDRTQYRMPGVGDPSFDSVETGAMVGLRGTWNEDGTLQAAVVAVLGGRQVRDVKCAGPYSMRPTCSIGQYENQACPTTCSIGTGPKLRESLEAPRLSPMTKTCSGGMVCGP